MRMPAILKVGTRLFRRSTMRIRGVMKKASPEE